MNPSPDDVPSRVSALVVLVLVACGLACGGLPDPKTHEQQMIELEARSQTARARAKVWRTLIELVPVEAPPSATQCPASVTESTLAPFTSVLAMDYLELPGAQGGEAWTFLRSGKARRLVETRDKGDDGYYPDVLGRPENRYLFAVVHTMRVLPVNVEQSGWLTPGSFEPGYIAGFVAVMDLDERELACVAPFEATNSESVPFDHGVDPTEVLRDDFIANTEAALNEAISGSTGISGAVDMVGICDHRDHGSATRVGGRNRSRHEPITAARGRRRCS